MPLRRLTDDLQRDSQPKVSGLGSSADLYYIRPSKDADLLYTKVFLQTTVLSHGENGFMRSRVCVCLLVCLSPISTFEAAD
jgi:hypothetical protein